LLIVPSPLVSIALKSLSAAVVSLLLVVLEVLVALLLLVVLPDSRPDTYFSNWLLLMEPLPLVSIALKS
jgi:hypothetical protein